MSFLVMKRQVSRRKYFVKADRTLPSLLGASKSKQEVKGKNLALVMSIHLTLRSCGIFGSEGSILQEIFQQTSSGDIRIFLPNF